MNHPRVLLGALAALVLAACSTQSSWTPPEPPAATPEVAALLPTGSFEVTGRFVLGDVPRVDLEGFVEFTSAPDGTGCKTDYTLTDVKPDSTATVRKVRAVRQSGGPEWYADATSGFPDVSDASVDWREGSDPSMVSLPFYLIPAIITSDYTPGVVSGAGTGWLCSIPVFPRFMDLEDDRLVFDQERAVSVRAAATGRWIEEYLTAVGVSGSTYDDAAREFSELATASFQSLMKGVSLSVAQRPDGGFDLLQYRDGKVMVTLNFTPAASREVDVPAARTWAQRVSEEVSGLSTQEILDQLDQLG